MKQQLEEIKSEINTLCDSYINSLFNNSEDL